VRAGLRALVPALALAPVLGCGEGREGGSAGRAESAASPIPLTHVQPDLFSAPGAQPLAWADFDGDGDLDLFVGFRGAPNRLYRNDGGSFVDVAPELGVADFQETRAAAWGDYDGDGDPDLFVGFRLEDGTPNRVYRNDGPGVIWVDVAPELGVDVLGSTRQTSWVDYDGDGDLDLFMAFRDQPNRLFRNEHIGGTTGEAEQVRRGAAGDPAPGGDVGSGGRAPVARFTDVTGVSGIGDPRRTVGVVWFDMDQDGDLDVFVANQNGDEDGFFRNDGGVFTDVASELGMSSPGRPEDIGGVGPALADYDLDGDLDLFAANYGPDALWRNDGGGRFTNVAPGTQLGADYHSTAAGWGDYDHDGWPDLFVASYLSGIAEVEDHLFRNRGGSFENVIPDLLQHPGASHGVSWADFDGDGDLDLLLANNDPVGGGHPLYRNGLPPEAAIRSVQVRVLDSRGVARFPGSEVRVYAAAAGWRRLLGSFAGGLGPNGLLGTGIVDAGGGYCSQSVVPVHVGLPPGVERVVVEVTLVGGGGRGVFTTGPMNVPLSPYRVVEIRLQEGVGG
jgi:hypothetical protein